MNEHCRAFTFINYHIPLTPNMGMTPDYSTVGFFDGLFTRAWDVDYSGENLRSLWRYILEKAAESKGIFSYQNIFGISRDEWNDCSDAEFWSEETDKSFPLTFVVFVQVGDYLIGPEKSIENQCRTFNKSLKQELGENVKAYIYGSIDKNDLIICIKSRKHRLVVNAIKQLHKKNIHIVYSYSTLSVSQKILNELRGGEYGYLYDEKIDSICLKGITNSFVSQPSFTLDEKYCSLGNQFIKRVYEGEDETVYKEKYRIYDILGDNDFRLIARDVSLGKLLEQYSADGILSYFGNDFRFYLYSSNLVLNTWNALDKEISKESIEQSLMKLDASTQSRKCEELDNCMTVIEKKAFRAKDGEIDDKIFTISRAVWQLLQSLKVLERSPVKRYDFISLYNPFKLLVDILEQNIATNETGDKAQLYEFIHKFSMTLNGTLRTDIQFFQVQDFNAIVHYAPAKLRAFYSMWAFELSAFYNLFSNGKHFYSFILSPGLFNEIAVEQLKLEGKQEERLMLITVPERELYSMKHMAIVLTHEVSHFVGTDARNRGARFEVWSEITARILELEAKAVAHKELHKLFDNKNQKKAKEIYGQEIYDRLQEEIWRMRGGNEAWCGQQNDLHSQDAIKKILETYHAADVSMITFIFTDFLNSLKKMNLEKAREQKQDEKIAESILNATKENEQLAKKMSMWFERFRHNMLYTVLKQIEHIFKETFADIMAILTLELSQHEYLVSFIKGRFQEFQDLDRHNLSVLEIRISIVVQTIKALVEKHTAINGVLSEEFCGSWRQGMNPKVIQTLSKGTGERIIAARVYEFIQKGVKNYTQNIPEYESFYLENNYNDFMNRSCCYFQDEIINAKLTKYTGICAEYYINMLAGDSALIQQKKEITKTYNIVAGESMTDAMQEIEDFLEKFKEIQEI